MTGELDVEHVFENKCVESYLTSYYVLCALRMNECSSFPFSVAGTWVNVASQATPKSWGDRSSQFHRADQRKNPEQRNFSQVQSM